MTFSIIAFDLFVIAGCLMPLVRRQEWWVRVFDFPRLQFFVLGLVSCLATFLALDLARPMNVSVLIALLAAMALQAWRIYPFTVLARHQVLATKYASPDATITLLVANVKMSNRNAARLAQIVRTSDPDLVLTLETDQWWVDQMKQLEGYPFDIQQPLDNRYGILLQSRLELQDGEVKHLVSEGVPSIHVKVRLRSGRLVSLHCLHPEPPSPTEADESTERDAELLIVAKAVADSPLPVIVVGDLNDVAWSQTTELFQKISGLLDPRIGRGMFNSFHAGIPLLRFPLDHVFHSSDFFLVELRRLPKFGSDHFPILASLELKPGAEMIHEEPEAEPEDRQQAAEKINKVDQRDEVPGATLVLQLPAGSMVHS